jgi:hypothetical protein
MKYKKKGGESRKSSDHPVLNCNFFAVAPPVFVVSSFSPVRLVRAGGRREKPRTKHKAGSPSVTMASKLQKIMTQPIVSPPALLPSLGRRADAHARAREWIRASPRGSAEREPRGRSGQRRMRRVRL